MNKRRPRSDDLLFISALLALLLGVALLMYTTGTVESAGRAWPFLVVAMGGCFLYLALVRGFSFTILFVGVVLALEGILLFAAIVLGWELKKVWPLGMALAGFGGVVSSIIAKKRMKVSLAVPSICFIVLGLVFSVFSFGLAGISFKSFIVVWWPTLLIAGGISLFVAYGLSRGGSSRREEKKDAGARSAGRPGRGRGRGPTSSA
jgi:hypothetical protein